MYNKIKGLISRISFDNERFVEVVILLLCAVGAWHYYEQYIPCLDDFRFHYWGYEAQNEMHSISEVWSAAWDYYQYGNGRYLLDVLQFFVCGFGYKSLFFILSSFLWCVLIVNFLYILRIYSKSCICDLPLVLIFLFFFVNNAGIVFFGSISFTANYLWGSSITFTFFSLYHALSKFKSTTKWWYFPLVFIFGALSGCWQESFTIGVAATLLIYHTLNFRSTNRLLLYLALGYGLGAAVVVLAPANFLRISVDKHAMSLHYLYQLFKGHFFWQSFIVVTFLSITIDIIKLKKVEGTWRELKHFFVVRHWLLYGFIFFTIIFCLFATYHGLYQITGVVLVSLLLTLLFVKEYIFQLLKNIYTHYIIACVILILVCFGYYEGYRHRRITYEAYNEGIESFVSSQKNYAIASKMFYYINVYAKQHKYARNMVNGVLYETLSSEGLPLLRRYYIGQNGSYSNHVSKFLHREPIEISDLCKFSNLVIDSVYYDKQMNTLIIEMPIGEECSLVVTYTAASFVEKMKDYILRRELVQKKINFNDPPYCYYGNMAYYIVSVPNYSGRDISDYQLFTTKFNVQ